MDPRNRSVPILGSLDSRDPDRTPTDPEVPVMVPAVLDALRAELKEARRKVRRHARVRNLLNTPAPPPPAGDVEVLTARGHRVHLVPYSEGFGVRCDACPDFVLSPKSRSAGRKLARAHVRQPIPKGNRTP